MCYGIIVRIASKLGVSIVKVKAENGSNAGFRLTLLDPKYNLDEPRYYNYKSIFKNFSKKEKEKSNYYWEKNNKKIRSQENLIITYHI